jgi:hypothetical protein
VEDLYHRDDHGGGNGALSGQLLCRSWQELFHGLLLVRLGVATQCCLGDVFVGVVSQVKGSHECLGSKLCSCW